jgi:hypothetical protein
MKFLIYIRISKEGTIRRKKDKLFPVLAVYSYEGFQQDKRNRGSGFKRHMDRMGQSILRNISKPILAFSFLTPMSCYSQQIPFRYSKRRSNYNSKTRHHNRINTFSELHGRYISDGRVLGFRTYILSYSEDY